MGTLNSPDSPEPPASAAPAAVRVLCVDDDAYFRAVMRTLVARTPGFRPIGEAASGEAAITDAVTLRPDLVLSDVRMPGIDGFEASSRLLDINPRLCIVLASADPIEPPSWFDPSGAQVVCFSKGGLSPRVLLECWQRHAASTPW